MVEPAAIIPKRPRVEHLSTTVRQPSKSTGYESIKETKETIEDTQESIEVTDSHFIAKESV